MPPLLRRLFLFSLFLTLASLALILADLSLGLRVPVVRPFLPYALLVGTIVMVTIYVGYVGKPKDPRGGDEDGAPLRTPLTPDGAARRIVEMVDALHRRGYERLRLGAGLAPSGQAWACALAAYAPDGARLTDAAEYASADGTRYFGWDDAADDAADDLAEKFVVRFPEIADVAYAPDPAYARWYAEMVRATAPTGLPIAYAEDVLPDDRLAVVGLADPPVVSLPPGGVL